MEGFQVVTMDDACKWGDIFVSTTGNVDRHHPPAHGPHEAQCIVCNIGHFDSENPDRRLTDLQWEEIKPQVDQSSGPAASA